MLLPRPYKQRFLFYFVAFIDFILIRFLFYYHHFETYDVLFKYLYQRDNRVCTYDITSIEECAKLITAIILVDIELDKFPFQTIYY